LIQIKEFACERWKLVGQRRGVMKAADVMVRNVITVCLRFTLGVRAVNDNLIIRPAQAGY
jgi:hypothetical protein